MLPSIRAGVALIRLMRQGRAGGLTLRQIAGQLNERLVPNKDGGTWQANTMRLIAPVKKAYPGGSGVTVAPL